MLWGAVDQIVGEGRFDLDFSGRQEFQFDKLPGQCLPPRSVGAAKTRSAALSRGVAGVRRSTLIVNLPGSPGAAADSLSAVIETLPHAVDVIRGTPETSPEAWHN